MPIFGLSNGYPLSMNRKLLYCGSTNTDSKIYLAEFKQLGTTGLALQH